MQDAFRETLRDPSALRFVGMTLNSKHYTLNPKH